jgi:hypothetical protein
MIKICKIFFLSVFALSATGCLYNPFQPQPPMYTELVKKNVGHQGVKKAMQDCGYKDLEGYNADFDRPTNDEIDRRRNCMLGKGFEIKEQYATSYNCYGFGDKLGLCQKFWKDSPNQRPISQPAVIIKPH